MTTFRNDPTHSPTARQSQGKMAGWISEPMDVICAEEGEGMRAEVCGSDALLPLASPSCAPVLDSLAEFEDRQVHRYHHAANERTQHDHDNGLHRSEEHTSELQSLRHLVC